MSFSIYSCGGALLIMMGQQTRSESLFYYFRIEDHIPEDHLLRLVDMPAEGKRGLEPQMEKTPSEYNKIKSEATQLCRATDEDIVGACLCSGTYRSHWIFRHKAS